MKIKHWFVLPQKQVKIQPTISAIKAVTSLVEVMDFKALAGPACVFAHFESQQCIKQTWHAMFKI